MHQFGPPSMPGSGGHFWASVYAYGQWPLVLFMNPPGWSGSFS